MLKLPDLVCAMYPTKKVLSRSFIAVLTIEASRLEANIPILIQSLREILIL